MEETLAPFVALGVPLAIDFLVEMGLSPRVEAPLRNFYDRLWRIMSLNGAASDGFKSTQSVLQGCAWSNPCAAAYAVAWAKWVEAKAAVLAYSYADDWYVVCDRFSMGEPEREPGEEGGGLSDPAPTREAGR